MTLLSNHRPAQQPRLWLVFILATYLLLALGYGLVNPLFEAPDEHWHYFTAQYIAETGALPRVTPEPDPWLAQEAAQPPLYYLLGSLIVRPVPGTDAARETVWPNPFVHLGNASVPVNRNAFVHGPWESWPWHGYALAAHLLRALSAVLGLGTLLAIYCAARLLWPARPARALLAVALVAFLPQFLFVHSAVSNDPLIILLVTVALWQLLSIWLGQDSPARMLLLGGTVGLATLAKTAGLLLFAYAGSLLLLRGWQRRHSLSALAKPLLLFAGPVLLLSGWFLWRNWTLYGDLTATNQFVRIAGGDRNYSLLAVLEESDGLWTSFFAIFGWFNVRAPAWVYWIWNGLVLLSVGGWVFGYFSRTQLLSLSERARLRAFRSSSARTLVPLVLAVWPLLVYAGLVTFMLRTPAAQGRLLFPALLPLALAFASGLDRWRWPPLLPLVTLLVLLTALYSLLFVIPPVYARPPQVTAAAMPTEALAHAGTVGPGMELAGAVIDTREVRPGEVLWLTLYWKAGDVSAETPEVVLELFGYEQALVGKFQGYPGRGLYPLGLWPDDGIIVDRFGVRLDRDMDAPTEVKAFLGLAGAAGRVPLGAAKAVPEKWPSARGQPLATLGDGTLLTTATVDRERARPGDRLTVSVEWQVAVPPGRALTTLLHLGEPDQPPLVTGDSMPRHGYYPTIWWEEGEVIRDQYTLDLPPTLPPGRYSLLIGMYDPESGDRLPLVVAGERQPADTYLFAWLTVE